MLLGSCFANLPLPIAIICDCLTYRLRDAGGAPRRRAAEGSQQKQKGNPPPAPSYGQVVVAAFPSTGLDVCLPLIQMQYTDLQEEDRERKNGNGESKSPEIQLKLLPPLESERCSL